MQIVVVSCKFMTNVYGEAYGTTSNAIRCIDYCLAQKASVISASWTCGAGSNPPLQEAGACVRTRARARARACTLLSADSWGRARHSASPPLHTHTLERSSPPSPCTDSSAVQRTHAAGVLFVTAAGNQGANLAATPYYPQSYAALYDNLLVVGATDEWDGEAAYSNHDPAVVHLSAPGNM